jgi:DNA-directed RNA polymerase subunit H (RpoH/RPB5)
MRAHASAKNASIPGTVSTSSGASGGVGGAGGSLSALGLNQSAFQVVEAVLQTVKEMMTDRGYRTLKPTSEFGRDFDDLRLIATNKHNHESDELSALIQAPEDIICIYFATDPKVSVKKIREYIAHLAEHKVSHAIVVYGHQITPGAKAEIPLELDFEMFQAIELHRNRTRHHLVPKHEKIETELEVLHILQQHKLKNKELLPPYPSTDVIVRYYHWKKGSVIRIYRRFGAQQESQIYYRIVVD